jgi:hypothetical protein
MRCAVRIDVGDGRANILCGKTKSFEISAPHARDTEPWMKLRRLGSTFFNLESLAMRSLCESIISTFESHLKQLITGRNGLSSPWPIRL